MPLSRRVTVPIKIPIPAPFLLTLLSLSLSLQFTDHVAHRSQERARSSISILVSESIRDWSPRNGHTARPAQTVATTTPPKDFSGSERASGSIVAGIASVWMLDRGIPRDNAEIRMRPLGGGSRWHRGGAGAEPLSTPNRGGRGARGRGGGFVPGHQT